MSKRLRKADIDALVLQSGRELEQAARALVPEDRDPEGKPLMLGPRMYRLRDQLDDETWDAYQSWARERNAYVHGETDAINNREEFYENYSAVLASLESLAAVAEEGEESYTGIALVVAVIVAALVYAC